MAHVVKAQVFHCDLRNFDAFDEVWHEFFPAQPPCRATVGIAGLSVPECLLEIDLTATVPSSPARAFETPAPRAPVNYSDAMRAGDLIFASGLMASDYKTGVPEEARTHPAFPYYGSNIKKQTRFILQNFAKVFEAAGSSIDRVVKAHVYLKDLYDFNGFDEVWREFFPTPPPRTTVGVPDLLVRNALVEVDLIAAASSVRTEVVQVKDIPQPLANYSPALRVGNLVFAAGALATDFKTGVAAEARVEFRVSLLWLRDQAGDALYPRQSRKDIPRCRHLARPGRESAGVPHGHGRFQWIRRGLAGVFSARRAAHRAADDRPPDQGQHHRNRLDC